MPVGASLCSRLGFMTSAYRSHYPKSGKMGCYSKEYEPKSPNMSRAASDISVVKNAAIETPLRFVIANRLVLIGKQILKTRIRAQ